MFFLLCFVALKTLTRTTSQSRQAHTEILLIFCVGYKTTGTKFSKLQSEEEPSPQRKIQKKESALETPSGCKRVCTGQDASREKMTFYIPTPLCLCLRKNRFTLRWWRSLMKITINIHYWEQRRRWETEPQGISPQSDRSSRRRSWCWPQSRKPAIPILGR